LLLTKILNGVKRKSLILKDLIEPLSLNSLFSQGGTPWTPPSLRWLFPYLKAYKIKATSCIKTHLRLRKKAGEMEITGGLVRIQSIPGHVTLTFLGHLTQFEP
jgi:hypothetical protein